MLGFWGTRCHDVQTRQQVGSSNPALVLVLAACWMGHPVARVSEQPDSVIGSLAEAGF
jgi:hypothetical protein